MKENKWRSVRKCKWGRWNGGEKKKWERNFWKREREEIENENRIWEKKWRRETSVKEKEWKKSHGGGTYEKEKEKKLETEEKTKKKTLVVWAGFLKKNSLNDLCVPPPFPCPCLLCSMVSGVSQANLIRKNRRVSEHVGLRHMSDIDTSPFFSVLVLPTHYFLTIIPYYYLLL